jgi:hypothetical protein
MVNGIKPSNVNHKTKQGIPFSDIPCLVYGFKPFSGIPCLVLLFYTIFWYSLLGFMVDATGFA